MSEPGPVPGSAASGADGRTRARRNRPARLARVTGPAMVCALAALGGHHADSSAARPPATPQAQVSTALERPSLPAGFVEALRRRAGFTRDHRGAFAAPAAGDAAEARGLAAGWHDGEVVHFAWHEEGDRIAFAAFDVRGETIHEPEVIGTGRWPRVAAAGERVAVAWATPGGSAVRVRDGARWGEPVALSGSEAAIAFAPGGELYAASSAGLWKLAAALERVSAEAYAQPAVAVDREGRPHVASVRGGRVVVDGEELDAGAQPFLMVDSDGTLHAAYVRPDGIRIRSRRSGTWTETGRVPAPGAAWPALAGAADGLRLTYLGPAEHGPDALWLARLAESEPILVPSLAGNVEEAWLLVRFAMGNPRSTYRPHDVFVSVNDVRVASFRNTAPDGRYLFRLDPRRVFTSNGRPVANRVSIRSRHVNGGHYMTSSDYELIVRTAWSERFAFGSTPAEVLAADSLLRVNHDQPDLAVLTNGVELPIARPRPGPLALAPAVANLGEGRSAAARLEVVIGSRTVQDLAVPALVPGEIRPVPFVLAYDGAMDQVELRLRQGAPDFDAANDGVTLRLWGRAEATPAELAPRGPAGDSPIPVPPGAEPPFLWRILDAASGREVARVERGQLSAAVPPGRYRLALREFQFEGQEVVFPRVFEHRAGGPPWPVPRSAVRFEPAAAARDLWRWQLVDAASPDSVVQWQAGEHPLMRVPPGRYRLAVKPRQWETQFVTWPGTIQVRQDETVVVRAPGVVRLETAAGSPPPWRWELVRAERSDEVVQWQGGDEPLMLAPPGEYRLAVRAFQWEGQRVLWPGSFRVTDADTVVVRATGAVRLETAPGVAPPWRWQLVRAERPEEVVQWQGGEQPRMVVPPGDYRLQVRPFQWDGQPATWPDTLRVREGEVVTARATGVVRLETAAGVPPVWRWQLVRTGRPEEVVQWQVGEQPRMLVPRGEYQVTVQPFQWEGQPVTWPDTLRVREGAEQVARAATVVRLETAPGVAPPWRWELVHAERPEEVVQWQGGEQPLMLAPAGEYRVSVQPRQWESERVVWPGTVTVRAGAPAVARLAAGIRFVLGQGVEPGFEFRALDASSGEVVQRGTGTAAPELVAPGVVAVEVRPEGSQTWQRVAERVVIEQTGFADVPISPSDLPD